MVQFELSHAAAGAVESGCGEEAHIASLLRGEGNMLLHRVGTEVAELALGYRQL